MTAYPGLGLENAKHKTQRIKVAWGATYFQRDPGRHTVTLKPSQAATAGLAWNASQGRASLIPAYLQVTPPNQRTHLTIPFAPGAIDVGTLHVTALAAQKPVKPTNPLKASVHKLTNHGSVTGPLRHGDTADVVVSGCGAGADGLATSKAFVGGSAQLVPSADRPTLQGFPKIAKVAAGTYRVSVQCPDVPTTAVTTITVKLPATFAACTPPASDRAISSTRRIVPAKALAPAGPPGACSSACSTDWTMPLDKHLRFTGPSRRGTLFVTPKGSSGPGGHSSLIRGSDRGATALRGLPASPHRNF